MPMYGKSGSTGSGKGRPRKKMGVHDALYAKPPAARDAKQMPKNRAGGFGNMSRAKAEQMKLRPASARPQQAYKQTGTTAALDEAYAGFGRGGSQRLVGNTARRGTKNLKGISAGSSRGASIARSKQVTATKRPTGKGARKGMR